MSYGVWSLVIFLTFAVGMLGTAWWTGRDDLTRVQLRAKLDQAVADQPPGPAYGPFPVDTGPLLILSETTAAGAALEREIRLRCEQAEEKIPARWR